MRIGLHKTQYLIVVALRVLVRKIVSPSPDMAGPATWIFGQMAFLLAGIRLVLEDMTKVTHEVIIRRLVSDEPTKLRDHFLKPRDDVLVSYQPGLYAVAESYPIRHPL